MPTIYPNQGAIKIAENVILGFVAPKLKLFKEIAAPLNVNTVLADFTEANFTGYADVDPIVFLGGYLDPDGGASVQTGTRLFQIASPFTVPNTVLGWYIEDDGVCVAAGTFPAPVALVGAGDAIPLDVILNFGRNS